MKPNTPDKSKKAAEDSKFSKWIRYENENQTLTVSGLDFQWNPGDLDPYKETKYLVLKSPTPYSLSMVGFFEKLESLRMERCDVLTPPAFDANVPRLHIQTAQSIEPSFAALLGRWHTTELSISRVSYIPDDFWVQLQNITLHSLSLEELKLGTLFFPMLQKMPSLEKLSLKNVSTPIDMSMLDVSSLSKLKELRIQGVQLPFLPRGFNNLESLEVLEISNVPIQDLAVLSSPLGEIVLTEPVEYNPQVFQGLKRLVLSGTQLHDLPKLPEPLSLEELQIQDMNVSNLPACYVTNLNILRLSGTNIKVLPSRSGLHIRELHIPMSNIKSLPDCYYTKDLQSLDLSASEVTKLSGKWFSQLTGLKSLNLSFTKIGALPNLTKTDPGCLNSLEELFLSGSMIKRLPDWLSRCNNLKYLSLRQLSLDCLPEKFLKARAGNYITIENWSGQSNPMPDNNNANLCVIDITGLNIRGIDTNLFRNDWWSLTELRSDSWQQQSLLGRYIQDEKKQPLHRANIALIGDQGVGKQEIAEKLTGIPLRDWEHGYGFQVTDDLNALAYIMEKSSVDWKKRPARDTKAQFMLFSGHASAQIIHPSFMTSHSLYIVILNEEKMLQRALYWTRMVEVYAPHSRIIYVVRRKESVQRLNLAFIRRDIWLDYDADVLYLPSSGETEDNDLTGLYNKISEHIQELVLYSYAMPLPWVQAIHHIESLLKVRGMLSEFDLESILQNYVPEFDIPAVLPSGLFSQSLENYLMDFLENRLGESMSPFFRWSSSFNMLNMLNSDFSKHLWLLYYKWSAEGLYRLIEYAQKNRGIVRIRDFWEYLVDNAEQAYSMEQVSYLLDFCKSQKLCFQTPDSLVYFPNFGQWMGTEEEKLNQIQQNDRSEIYTIHCPLLSGRMLAEFSYMNHFFPSYDSGAEGFLVRKGNVSVLAQGTVGAETELRLFFMPKHGGVDRQKVADVVHNIFSQWRQCLEVLPEYMKRKYTITIERCSGNRTDTRFLEKDNISMQNLYGYQQAGRSEYFSGILNRQYPLDNFIFPDSD